MRPDILAKRPRHAGCRIHGNDECVPGLDYSFNADIWGVGILAFECCTGKGPYEKTGKCVCTRARHVCERRGVGLQGQASGVVS